MNYIHIGWENWYVNVQRGIFQVLKDNNYIRDYNHEEMLDSQEKY